MPAPLQPPEPAQRRRLLRATVDRLVEPLIVVWAARADDRAGQLEQQIAALASHHAAASAAVAELEQRVEASESRVAALLAELADERRLRAGEVAAIGAGLADQSALARRLATLEDAMHRPQR